MELLRLRSSIAHRLLTQNPSLKRYPNLQKQVSRNADNSLHNFSSRLSSNGPDMRIYSFSSYDCGKRRLPWLYSSRSISTRLSVNVRLDQSTGGWSGYCKSERPLQVIGSAIEWLAYLREC